MPQLAVDFPTPRAVISLWDSPLPVAPPSSAVVAAVLAFADQREASEDGTVLIRFSPARLDRDDMRLLLGPEVERALDVSIVWDDQEDEIVRVLDLAPLRTARESGRRANRYAQARHSGPTSKAA